MNVSIAPQELKVSATPQSLGASTGTPIARDFIDRDPYEGDYIIIPSAEKQILQTKYLRMTDNVTINPIPQNYGLITWNGSFLTVS